MTYMMTADQSIKGKLLEIFKAYSAALTLPDKPRREAVTSDSYLKMREQVKIYRQDFVDDGSFYHKNVLTRRISGEALEIAPGEPLSFEALESLAAQMKNVYSPERIRLFVESFFDSGKTVAESEGLPLNDDTDFILLILAVARSRERDMNYTVEVRKERVNVNGYVIPKMRFSRKGAAGNA
jgi:hypothetical protein